jgi:hypothetical protein
VGSKDHHELVVVPKRTSMLFANLTKPARTGSVHVEIPPDDEVSQVLRADLFLEHIG